MHNPIKLTPWEDELEFHKVYNWLYGRVQAEHHEIPASDANEVLQAQSLGVKRVKAWIQRCKTPAYVETTASLIEVQLFDQTRDISVGDDLVRLMYSMAFIRFVNGMIDPHKRNNHVASMFKIAGDMDFPLYHIHLRHQATHEDLPPLHALRDATSEALEWLDLNRWIKKPTAKLSDDDIKKWLNSYKLTSKALAKGSSRTHEKTMASMELLSVDGQRITPELSQLIPILLEEGNMVPLRKKKRPSLDQIELDEGHIKIWTPLVLTLVHNYPEFLAEFINYAANQLTSVPSNLEAGDYKLDSSILLTFFAWAVLLIKWQACGDLDCEVPLDEVLNACITHPTEYSLMLVEEIFLVFPSFRPKLQSKVKLATWFLSLPEKKHKASHDYIHESQILLESTYSKAKEDEPLTSISEKSYCPIGMVVGCESQTLDLPLSWDTLPHYIPPYLVNSLTEHSL
ncbi:rRNA-processing protein las1 [Entomophthora muscae]|uniref:rRNA-processing protein las1 n=1 Tax=Entomophthora muscae TaxID=34485 RepID=A0ACC2SHD9_9FUNG|nr:rRNA-processing protein las1 [Entomophthora muscae]